MHSLAAPWHYGPGPWILVLPVIWVAIAATVITVLRRTGWAGRRGPGRPAGPDDPMAVLGRRFASGEIDEDEYWRRSSVLNESFGADRAGR